MDTSLKLYFAPRTRASRPRWLLEELGAPYELVTLDLAKGEHKQPEYLAIHPLGSVPALADGEMTLFESAAICLYLADKFIDKGLAPAFGSPARGPYYQWMTYAMATLEPVVVEYASHTALLPEEKRSPEAAAKAKERYEQVSRPLFAALAKGPFVLGDALSAADLLLASIINWARGLKLPVDAAGEAWLAALKARPSFRRAMS
jgi:glutathione S-transferase